MANNHTANTANPMEYMKPGLGHTPSYQVSGIPWLKTEVISSTVVTYSFPSVTRAITIKANGTGNNATLKMAFSENGLSTNYYELHPGESVTLDVKVTQLFLVKGSTNDITSSVAAALTGIPAGALQNNWSGSAGVG